MEKKDFGYRFMTIMSHLLEALSFDVGLYGEPMMQNKYHPDLYILKGNIKGIVETKFYRSRQVSRDLILTSASILASFDIITINIVS